MSVEGFMLRRKRCRTAHNMFQLVSDGNEHFDILLASKLVKLAGKAAEEGREVWTFVPPGYRWELVK